jgi:hypothetical protein
MIVGEDVRVRRIALWIVYHLAFKNQDKNLVTTLLNSLKLPLVLDFDTLSAMYRSAIERLLTQVEQRDLAG